MASRYNSLSEVSVLPVSLISFNCRGFNSTKKTYVNSLLSQCDILFLQEHWLSELQLSSFNCLSHYCHGVCGFSTSEVLHGRPYGGCAIFWRQGLCCDVELLDTGSRRVCAIRCAFRFGIFVFINVYMPCDSDNASRSEFCDTLNIVESVVDDNDGCYVVLGGDFNVDFDRDWCNTSTLRSFCTRLNLYPVIFHDVSQVDYSYHFSMKHFHNIDHFIVSEQLFQESVNSFSVIHDVDNTSDHDPICLQISIDVQRFNTLGRCFTPRVAWHKANSNELYAYAALLNENLDEVSVPRHCIECRNVDCNDKSHFLALEKYLHSISDACLNSATQFIPYTALRSSSSKVAGWNETVRPAREKSLFWHNMWKDCGKPRSGYVVLLCVELELHIIMQYVL